MAKIKIFTATYHRFEATKKSLLSLKWSIESQKEHDIELFIGDNNSDKNMKTWLYHTFSNNIKYKIFLNDKNIGKPAIINNMWKNCNKECDVFVSFDSDLVTLPDHQDWINRCVRCLEAPLVGVVSTEQTEQCCHLKNLLDRNMKFEDNNLIYGKYFGVAGGCIFLKKDLWEKMNGYFVYGVYGGDDASVMHKCFTQFKKLCVVNKSAPLFHPFDTDKKYVEWKGEACKKIRAGIKDLGPGYFEDNKI